jgi:hypothetical protein
MPESTLTLCQSQEATLTLAAPWSRACVSSVFHHANEFLCYNIKTFLLNLTTNGSRHENVLEFNFFFFHLVTHFFKKVKIDVVGAPSLVQSCNGSKILYCSVTSVSRLNCRLKGLVQLEDAFCQVWEIARQVLRQWLEIVFSHSGCRIQNKDFDFLKVLSGSSRKIS